MIQGFSGGLLNRQLIYNLDLPSFQRDFASLKTLDHGTGPAITFTRASNATYFDANGALQTAANDVPRFDHSQDGAANSLGLLIEESRTNSIRNSQAGGSTNGVIGSGGALPANWFNSTPAGNTYEILGTGTQNGLVYIDIKFSGTNSSGSNIFPAINFESLTHIVAAQNQAWTGSFYVTLTAGTTSGVSSFNCGVSERDASGTQLANSQTTFTPSATRQRIDHTRTMASASTGRVMSFFSCTVANGNSYDFTLRIAAPQLEQGAFPTSYIPTTTAAATRSADSAIVTPISSFYNQSEGTLFAEGSANTSVTLPALVSIDDTTGDERIQLRRNQTSSQGFLTINDGGVSQVGIVDGSWTTTAQTVRLAAAYSVNDFAVSFSGGTVATDSSGTLPTVTRMDIGAGTNSGRLNAHIRKIAYYPRRLSNTLLQQLTT